MATIADLFTKYHCTNCRDDIVGIRVHCAECESFDLCLQCFAAGAEIGPHLNNHDYQFMDTGTTILSIYRGKGAWTAREEIRLLDAIEQYGYGNWEDISKHIETKSAEDAKEEYVNKFVNGTIGRHTWIPAQSQRPILVDHTSEDNGPLGASAIQNLPPLDITTEEAAQLGYMPNRDGFEREYDPTAEQLISNLSLNAEDTEADYLLKLAQVDMYTRRLRERARRKRLVRDYQLVANCFRNRNYSQHPGMTREQKEFRDRFRVFAQFYTSNEYERLLASLDREKELRIRLSELCRYRYNGLTKIDECRHFEQHAAMSSHRSTGPYGHGKTDHTHPNNVNPRQPGSSALSPQLNTRKIEMANGNGANSSSIVQKSMHHIVDQTSSAGLSHNKSYLDNYRGSSAPSTTPIMIAQGDTSMTTNNLVQHQLESSYPLPTQKNLPQLQVNVPPIGGSLADVNNKEFNSTVTYQHLQDLNNKYSNGFSIPISSIVRSQLDELKNLPSPLGTNMLSSNEQQLCKLFNLSPSTYLSLKTILLSGVPLSNLSPIETSLKRYFIKVGWLGH